VLAMLVVCVLDLSLDLFLWFLIGIVLSQREKQAILSKNNLISWWMDKLL